MIKELIEQLNNIPQNYDPDFRKGKETELLPYKQDLQKVEIIEDLLKHKYIKDFISTKKENYKIINEQIMELSEDLSKANIRKIQLLQGRKKEIEETLKEFEIPDIEQIKKVIEEELKFIKNGQ